MQSHFHRNRKTVYPFDHPFSSEPPFLLLLLLPFFLFLPLVWNDVSNPERIYINFGLTMFQAISPRAFEQAHRSAIVSYHELWPPPSPSPPSTSSRYDRCNFVVDWDVVAIAIERWAVHGFSGYPKLLRYVNILEFRVLFEQEWLFLKKKIIIIIYMNTKKFVAMDSTIHYLQSFEKKMESWKSIWKFKNGNFKI